MFLLAVLSGHWVKLRASPAKSPGALNLFQQTWRLANLVTGEANGEAQRSPEGGPVSSYCMGGGVGSLESESRAGMRKGELGVESRESKALVGPRSPCSALQLFGFSSSSGSSSSSIGEKVFGFGRTMTLLCFLVPRLGSL